MYQCNNLSLLIEFTPSTVELERLTSCILCCYVALPRSIKLLTDTHQCHPFTWWIYSTGDYHSHSPRRLMMCSRWRQQKHLSSCSPLSLSPLEHAEGSIFTIKRASGREWDRQMKRLSVKSHLTFHILTSKSLWIQISYLNALNTQERRLSSTFIYHISLESFEYENVYECKTTSVNSETERCMEQFTPFEFTGSWCDGVGEDKKNYSRHKNYL